MKIMLGAFLLADSNKLLTRLAPTPTYFSTNSLPDMQKNGTPAQPAQALASRVLPVPGGPVNRAPRGILAPSSVNFSGIFRNSTNQEIYCLAYFMPATSSNFILDIVGAVGLYFCLVTLDNTLDIALVPLTRMYIMSRLKQISNPALSLPGSVDLASDDNLCSNSTGTSGKASSIASTLCISCTDTFLWWPSIEYIIQVFHSPETISLMMVTFLTRLWLSQLRNSYSFMSGMRIFESKSIPEKKNNRATPVIMPSCLVMLGSMRLNWACFFQACQVFQPSYQAVLFFFYYLWSCRSFRSRVVYSICSSFRSLPIFPFSNLGGGKGFPAFGEVQRSRLLQQKIPLQIGLPVRKLKGFSNALKIITNNYILGQYRSIKFVLYNLDHSHLPTVLQKYNIPVLFHMKSSTHKPLGSIKHQNPKQPNKAHLVDFMRKLTEHIIGNKIVQLSVFQSLNNDDLQMLFQSLSDESQLLRKTAAKFICYLLHDNDRIQRFLIERERVCCTDGKFLLNEIPKDINRELLAEILRIVNGLSEGEDKEQVCPICWTINLQTKEVKWLYWNNSAEAMDFIDPLNHLFGIIRTQRSPNTKRLINKTTLQTDKNGGKPEYLDRLLKRKSVKDK